jgi:hypothetical protein
MQNITTITELREAIIKLEEKQAREGPLLKGAFLEAYESLKLINVIKSAFKKAFSAPDLQENIINTAIGVSTGYIAKKTIVGKTNNPFKKLLGIILEITVANKIANNAGAIKTAGGILLNKLIQPGQNSANK